MSDNPVSQEVVPKDSADGLADLLDGLSLSPEKVSYETMRDEIISAAESIAKNLPQEENGDGRIVSAIQERPFLDQLKEALLKKHPGWDIEISKDRHWYDIRVNSIPINLKITRGNSSDNAMNKQGVYVSITGKSQIPEKMSSWPLFRDRLKEAKIQKERNRLTEYHYLVVHKQKREVLFRSILDIHRYINNPSNILQICWNHEFGHRDYLTPDETYLDKVRSLLDCIQKSLRAASQRILEFGNEDMESFF